MCKHFANKPIGVINMKKKAMYSGSFDPLTFGHLDIIERASGLVDKLYVSVTENVNKRTTFTAIERKQLIEESIGHLKNVEVVLCDILTVELANKLSANFLIRGLRAVTDFEYELQLALANRTLNSEIETIFLMTSGKHSFLSSSMVKEIARYGGDTTELVPKHIGEALIKKFNN